jgi:hypothetical protein
VKLGFFNSAITDSGGVPTGMWSPVEVNPRSHTYQNLHHTYEVCVDELHEGPPYHSGGPFRKLKATISYPYGGVYGKGTYVRSDKKERYVGGFRAAEMSDFGVSPMFQTAAVLNSSSSYYPSMTGWGDKAFARTRPRIQSAGGFVFAAELRDAPRLLRQTSHTFHNIWRGMGGNQVGRVMAPKALADSFLNFQFGWKPFLSDLRNFDYVIQNYHQLSASRKERNNKWIRKRVPLKTSVPVRTKIDSGLGYKLDPFLSIPDYFKSQPTWELWEETTSHISGVGSFKYYLSEFDASLPEFNSGWNQMMRVLDITGFRVSPSNIYRATPWTWAVDWVTNMGDHVDQLTDTLVDSIACKYCYVMQTQIKTRKFIATLPLISDTLVLTFTQTLESKMRDEASSPYGFSLSWADLTPTQIAIAGALGISRW